ncbi:hypothetical protein GWN19_04995 [Candidatus Bathyarchaeota archaeon]|nr:hypothetical protein [Candidatus Bathyarchaeota archaeon]
MKVSIRLLQLLIIAAFSFSLLIMAIYPKTTQGLGLTRARGKERVDLDPDQSFSCAAGSTIEYNIYIINQASSMANYTLTALSDQGYYVEVWRDNDQLGGGDIQLIPPQGSIITLDAGEVATLIVRVTVPSNATDGTVDATIIEAVNTYLDTSDSVTVITTINSGLPHPSNWIQLGSDSTFPNEQERPKKVDVKALYYTNNGTHVFFRMAEADTPDQKAFLYNVYLDTKAGGQQIDSYYYDYMLSSDGILYEWNGTDWVDSGYPTYWRVDGTGIVLWTDLDNLSLDTQDIHILACTTTKDRTMKDKEGPYIILRNNISEIPLILIPLVTLAIYFAVSSRKEKNAHTVKAQRVGV